MNVKYKSRLRTMARRTALTLLLFLSALPLLAEHHVIDFESQAISPSVGEEDIWADQFMIQGGRVDRTSDPRFTTHCYFTRKYQYFSQYGLQPQISLHFWDAVSNVEFDLWNGDPGPAPATYLVTHEYPNPQQLISVRPFGRGDGSNIVHVKMSGKTSTIFSYRGRR